MSDIIQTPREYYRLTLVTKSDVEEIHLEIQSSSGKKPIRIPATRQLMELLNGRPFRDVIGSICPETGKFQIWESR